ncbi:MAG: DedA family protein, partial [Actinomycetota bacterium]|nr:DedA family protein [Actinomycetota bacterium]
MTPLLAALGFLDFLDPERIIRAGGLMLLGIIVFAESGLLVGFFLPGDSLLFVAGFLASEAGGKVLPALPWVLLVTFVAAVTGDQVGYLFGRKVGPALFARPDSRFFKQANVD